MYRIEIDGAVIGTVMKFNPKAEPKPWVAYSVHSQKTQKFNSRKAAVEWLKTVNKEAAAAA